MRIYTLTCELLVKRSVKETFAFFENPANLGKITPMLNFNIVTRNVLLGRGFSRHEGLPIRFDLRKSAKANFHAPPSSR